MWRSAIPISCRLTPVGPGQSLAAKQQLLGAGHSQLLPYYFFLAQLHLAEGSLPAAVALDRQALEVCEKNDGPDGACAGAVVASYRSSSILHLHRLLSDRVRRVDGHLVVRLVAIFDAEVVL